MVDQFFYDGTCGLCHGAVRFVLARDRGGTAFTFAPLHGETFTAAVPADQRAALPDSVVIRTDAGALLARSDAAIYVFERLGGLWRVLGRTMRVVPKPARDLAYDFVASRRYRWFGRETSACPIVPQELRSRFHP